MDIHLFSMMCLDENEYPDLNLYKHFIDYYKQLGIESNKFTIIPCGVDNYENNFEEFQEINNTHNIPNLNLISKKYDIFEANNILLKWQETIDKEDWILFPDPDEFMEYGRFDNIPRCVEFLEKNNYYALRGEFEDRITNNLILRKVEYPENLFNQFPKRASITKYIIGASCLKILVSKAKIELRIGHHDILWNTKKKRPALLSDNLLRTDPEYWLYSPLPAPTVYNGIKEYDPSFKVYHFKWTESLIHKLKNPNKHMNLYNMFNEDRKRTNEIITGNKFNIIIR